MRDLIIYISALLNIKHDSTFVVLDMEEEVLGIKDLVRYRKYIKANENYLGSDYKTGLQKFNHLTAKYKAMIATEENTDRLANGNKFALELSAKVGAVEIIVLNFTIPNDTAPDISFDHFIDPETKDPFLQTMKKTHLKTLDQSEKL